MIVLVLLLLFLLPAPSWAATYGKPAESCHTTITDPTATVLSTTDAWETTIEAASAGAIFLLNAGTYTPASSGDLVIPKGTAAAPIRVYPNNCAVANLRNVILRGWNIVAGFTNVSPTAVAGKAAFIVRPAVPTDLSESNIIRNNGITNTVAVCASTVFVNDGAKNTTITGNDISANNTSCASADTTSPIFLKRVSSAPRIENTIITDNKISGITGDGVQFGGVDGGTTDAWHAGTGNLIHNNWFASCAGENCIDIKRFQANTTLTISNNHLAPTDGGGCSIIAGHGDTYANSRVNIIGNYFQGCFDRSIRLGVANQEVNSPTAPQNQRNNWEFTVENNVFVHNAAGFQGHAEEWVRVEVNGAVIRNNTVTGGDFQYATAFSITDTVLSNNSVSNSSISGTPGSGSVCNKNNFRTVTGIPGICTNTNTDDPQFVNVATKDYNSQQTTFIDAGTTDVPFNGLARDLGALEAPLPTSCVVENATPTVINLTWTNNGWPPLAIGSGAFTSTGRTINSSVLKSGSTNISDHTLSTAVLFGQAVNIIGAYGAATDSLALGGPELNLNSKSKAFTLNCQNNVGGGAPSFQFTQSNFQFYGLPLVSGALEKRPVGAAVNVPVRVVRAGSVIVSAQIDCTLAPCPTIAAKLQYNLNSGGWVDVPASFGVGNVRFSGLTNADPQYPGQGFTISSCLSGALTPVTGSLQRTQDAVPNFSLGINQCIVLAAMVDFDADITPSDSYLFRYINQDGTLFSYSQTPNAIMREYSASF